jgi:hypothetical protein
MTLANIDGVIFAKAPVEIRGQVIEGLGGHEIKSAKTDFGWGEDEIPDAYYARVQHYMKVTGLPLESGREITMQRKQR